MNRLLFPKLLLVLALASGLNLQATTPVIPPEPIIPITIPHPHIYLVYSGEARANSFTAAHGPVIATRTLFLVTDLANPGSYSLLSVGDKNNPGYHIYTRVLSPNGSYVATYDDGIAGEADPSDDLLANAVYTPVYYPPIYPLTPIVESAVLKAGSTVSTPTQSGLEAFKFSLFGTEALASYLYPYPIALNSTAPTSNYIIFPFTHTYPRTGEIYATGPLTGLSSQGVEVVIPANKFISPPIAPAAVISSDLPPYQVNAITTPYFNYIGTKLSNAVIKPFAPALSGSGFTYDYDASLISPPLGNFSALAVATGAGTVSLTLNTTLSGLANVGGSYEVPPTGPVVLPLSMEIAPISGPLDFSHPYTEYETFLYHIVLSLGQDVSYVPAKP